MVNRRQKRAVSEIVAAILLVMIVVSLGTSIILYFYRQRSNVQNAALSQMQLAKNIQQQPVFTAYYSIYNTTNNTLTVLLTVGPGFLEIVSIYLNDTLVNTQASTVYLNNQAVNNPQVIVINSTGVNIIKVIPETSLDLSPGDSYILKVVSSVGTYSTVIGKAVD